MFVMGVLKTTVVSEGKPPSFLPYSASAVKATFPAVQQKVLITLFCHSISHLFIFCIPSYRVKEQHVGWASDRIYTEVDKVVLSIYIIFKAIKGFYF